MIPPVVPDSCMYYFIYSAQQPLGVRYQFSSFAEVEAKTQSLQGTWKWSYIWNLVEPQFENARKVCECDFSCFFHLCQVQYMHSDVLKGSDEMQRQVHQSESLRLFVTAPCPLPVRRVWNCEATPTVRQGGTSLESGKEPCSLASVTGAWFHKRKDAGCLSRISLSCSTAQDLVHSLPLGVLSFYFYWTQSFSLSTYFLYLVLTSANS